MKCLDNCKKEECNAYICIAQNCGLSKNTVRNAFSRQPVSEKSARILANYLDIRLDAFVIKADRRGRPPKVKNIIENIQKVLGKQGTTQQKN